MEGYEVDGEGKERGIQAKFFLGKPTSHQWTSIFDSVKRALDTHPNLVELTIALPADRADPRIPNEQWFMDEWVANEKKWHSHARSLGREVAFSYMGKSEIADALSREEHAGRYRWWFDGQLLSGRWLQERLEEIVKQVGPRYNSQLTVDVLAGRQIVRFARRPRLLVELEWLASAAADHLGEIVAQTAELETLTGLVAALPRPINGMEPVTGPHTRPSFELWRRKWRDAQQEAWTVSSQVARGEHGGLSSSARAVGALVEVCEQATTLIDEESPAYEAPAMLLWGDAGAGKTHLLCDTATRALDVGQPAVVVLGQQLGAGQPWTEILAALRFEGTADEFLQALSARAEATGQRALLLIDAINENNGPQVWPNHLAAFLTLARRYPWVGVVLSVRTAARGVLVASHIAESDLLSVEHTGFAEAPFDALVAFFNFYGLPLPAAPLALYQEVANPLLLRLYCQAATREPGLLNQPLPGFSRIVDAVLADVDVRARVITQADQYQEIALPACRAVAALMRRLERSYLTREEAAAAVNGAVSPLAGAVFARTPLAALISEGLLAEDILPGPSGQRRWVIRFAFERIGDHLGAQALLDALDAFSATEDLADRIATALVGSGGTGVTAASTSYRLRSTFDALAILLPEQHSCELFELPVDTDNEGTDQAAASAGWQTHAWLSSLIMREPSALTDAARHRLANLVLGPADVAAHPLNDERRAAIRTTLALSVHPDQPLGPDWLHNMLAPLTMVDRDRRWTAQLRGTSDDDNPYTTLIHWCREMPPHVLTVRSNDGATFAVRAAVALMWALPSPDRFLRDTATRAMVSLTDHDPSVVTVLLGAAAGIDDGYLVERVLAVVCGAVLRGNLEPRTVVADLQRLLDRHGLPRHVLARDYLVTVVTELANCMGEDTDFSTLANSVRPPYPADWPGPLGLPDWDALETNHPPFETDVDEERFTGNTAEQEAHRRKNVARGYVSISSSVGGHGDFNRHVMNIDMPHSFPFSRRRLDEPLDGESLEDFDLTVLPGWIFARVLELGWNPQIFGEVDTDINWNDNHGRTSHKQERFGKKYQWLAWHEALARLSGTQRLRDETNRRRDIPYQSAWQLDFVRDIDPTHLCDRQTSGKKPGWQTLWTTPPVTIAHTVTATPDTEGPVDAPDALATPDLLTPWWFPVPRLRPPATPSADPVEDLAYWAVDGTDLPDLSPYLVVTADIETWLAGDRSDKPVMAGTRYRVLTTSAVELLDQQVDHDIPHARLQARIDSVLVRRSDLDQLRRWPGNREPHLDEHSLDVSITDAIFLGEWPDAEAYLSNCTPDFRPRTWQDTVGTDAIRLGVPVVVTVERYCWEGSIYDCSLSATLAINLLTPATAALFPGLRQRDGIGRTISGELLHLDPNPEPDSKSALLIDETLLAEALDANGLVLIQIVEQRKQVFIDTTGWRFAGETLQIQLVGTIGDQVVLNTTATRTLPPRLDDR